MPLNAGAAIVIWSNTRTPEAWADWHSHEHFPERLALPGFLQARRMLACDPGASAPWFILYEVEDPSAMTSPAYFQSLNNPTDWSREMMPNNLYLNRTLCSVVAGAASGVAAFALPLVFDVPDEKQDTLKKWVEQDVLPRLSRHPMMTGSRLMLNVDRRDRPETQEEKLRGHRNASVDGVLLLEGFDEASLRTTAKELCDQWVALGGEALPAPQLYRLAHTMSKADMS